MQYYIRLPTKLMDVTSSMSKKGGKNFISYALSCQSCITNLNVQINAFPFGVSFLHKTKKYDSDHCLKGDCIST